MRILHVIPAVAPRYGGPSRAIFEMCRALQEQGLETLIATTDADGRRRLPLDVGRSLTYKGVATIFFPRQWSEAFKYSRPLARWLDANVKEYDVVHIHAVFSHACLAAARACRRHGVPYIVRPLGTLDPWSLRQKPIRKRLLWYGGVRLMLHEAAAIHYTTSVERRLAEDSLGLDCGRVIPLGIDVESLDNSTANGAFRRRYPALDKEPYVLVLSRLHPKKGLELLLKAFLALTKQPEFANWRLVLAGEGEGDYVASLRRLAQNGGTSSRVLFPGWLAGADKISALQGASLLTLPSHQENFGLCVVEALACGVPVLISPHVNLAEDIENAGAGWITPLEYDALLKTLAEALRRTNERARRGEAGRTFVRTQFMWSAVAAKLGALYSSIAKK